MTEENAQVGMSKIIDAILNIFDVIPILNDENSGGQTDKFGERIIQISALLIILFFIVGVGLAAYTQGFEAIIKAIQAYLFVVGVSMVAFGLLFLVKKHILT
ncbi:MAG: hypothetical protein ACI9FN_003181 [Saprospiraceae bacterium]|jgi:predicted phage tail protein